MCQPIKTPLNPPPWLNPPRIRRQALLLATALWLGYAATIATPGPRDRFGHLKGADFLHAYVLGTLALEHRGEALYDARAQRELGEQRVPASAGDYFLPVYAPQYSLIWAPLALLPYPWAAAIWIVLSAAIYAACCYAIWQTCPNLSAHGTTVALAAAAFPGFFALITFGQNSALALAALTATYFALRARREFLAGLCLGLLAYKPQLALVPACVFAAASLWPRETAKVGNPALSEGKDSVLKGHGFSRAATRIKEEAALAAEGERAADSHTAGAARSSAMKVIVGALLCILAQFAAACIWYGRAPLIAYARVLTHIGAVASILEPRPYLMHSLRAFWNLLLPWPGVSFGLYLLTAVAALALAIACWRKPVPLHHRFAIMLLATVLVAPHLTVYDLVIIAPAFLWIADWLATHAVNRIAWLLYLSCLLPYAGPLARWTHLQLSVICLAILTISFAAQLTSDQVFPET
jgi:hypothetical protein